MSVEANRGQSRTIEANRGLLRSSSHHHAAQPRPFRAGRDAVGTTALLAKQVSIPLQNCFGRCQMPVRGTATDLSSGNARIALCIQDESPCDDFKWCLVILSRVACKSGCITSHRWQSPGWSGGGCCSRGSEHRPSSLRWQDLMQPRRQQRRQAVPHSLHHLSKRYVWEQLLQSCCELCAYYAKLKSQLLAARQTGGVLQQLCTSSASMHKRCPKHSQHWNAAHKPGCQMTIIMDR